MKKQIIFFLLALLNLPLFAQDKAALTKEETIRYLDKKLKEVVGHYRTPTNGKEPLYFKSCEVEYENDRLVIKNSRKNMLEDNSNCNYNEWYNTSIFNPKDIKEIIVGAKNDSEPVGSLKIVFVSQTCKEIWEAGRHREPCSMGPGCCSWIINDHKEFSTTEIIVPYLASDISNFNKIKKALEHLRDLCKAEDDPFGDD